MKETPKNIRQVGGIDEEHKIYVEDYVITYTRTLGDALLNENREGYKAAILLGSKERSGRDKRTYVSGMVCIDEFSLSGEAAFTNEVWSGIYDKIKAYYEDEEIVGWMFMGCLGEQSEDSRLANIHTANFNGKNMIFINYNCEEKEEMIFDYFNGKFIRRKGFYIYYEKNRTMQNYMLAGKEMPEEPEYESDNLVKGMRETINRRSEQQDNKRLVRSIYATGMLVAAVALLIGSTAIYNMNNSDKNVAISGEGEVKSVFNNENGVSGGSIWLRDDSDGADAGNNVTNETSGKEPADFIEKWNAASLDEAGSDSDGNNPADVNEPKTDNTDNKLTENTDSGKEKDVKSEASDGSGQETADNSKSDGTGKVDSNNSKSGRDEQAAENSNSDSTGQETADNSKSDGTGKVDSNNSESGSSEQAADNIVSTSTGTYSFYIVKSGDSLGSIAESIYDSVSYVQVLMEANNISDPDKIYEGQKLWLPERRKE